MTTTPERTATLTTLVAAEIRAWMGRLDVRQSELARRIEESDQWLSMRLKGRTPIDLNELQRIATALGLTVLDLMPAGASRVSGATGGGPTQTIVPVESSSRPRLPVRTARTGSHVATRPGPLGQGGRRDATRPVSAVPANLRRPAPTRPITRPMPR